MNLSLTICDVCHGDVDEHPLRLSAWPESSPTGDWLDVDLCSLTCLRAYVNALVEELRP